ncbi:protein DMP7 [Selaginella moellendorffii]|nr:protein DMP7 [Selaginella moellendorffii]|eukprot:XP_002966216.2 protein DMP7 [Selaginella moellendorffii]
MDNAGVTQRLLPTSGAPTSSSSPPDDHDHATDDEKLSDDIKEFQNFISRTLTTALHGSANLANMLPTGTVLFFQMLDPILFRAGSCENKLLSAIFLLVCAILCFTLSFTDSFQAPNGKVYYGLATFRGLWTPQIQCTINLSQYRIRFSDFVHALLAVFAFMTTTTFSTDVVSCFVKVPDSFVGSAPALSGFLVSAVFLYFPTNRHGVGFPLTPPGTSPPPPPSTETGSSTANKTV